MQHGRARLGPIGLTGYSHPPLKVFGHHRRSFRRQALPARHRPDGDEADRDMTRDQGSVMDTFGAHGGRCQP